MNKQKRLYSDIEKKNIERREAIAKMIRQGKTYDEIRKEIKCSTSTISNVKKLMKGE